MPEPLPTNTVVVRPLALQDYDRWLPLWRSYQSFYKVEIARDVTAETWRRVLDPAEPLWGALAWTGEAAVGLVHWIFHRSTWTVGDYCYLQDLFVDQATRGSGVGRRLIAHVGDDAVRIGASRVYWLTHESNHQAMTLYDRVAEKSGFVQYRQQLGRNAGQAAPRPLASSGEGSSE